MSRRNEDDWFDWRGCEAFRFDPQMVGGRGNVDGTRMFAHTVLENFDDGLTAEKIAEAYQLDVEPVRQIIAFASLKRLKVSA